ncbi:vWA domain-containing protein [Agarilytica rhodophyticola]|uniref:vWA domain-containing protein n=1 Tax=Agarilytica rhodophyticola TaxID=1737490 RepID=UPI000B34740F|nr:VWA domain-containing protein [Agarilytica rhodophyticola]
MSDQLDLQFDRHQLRAMQEKLVIFIRHLAAYGFQVDVNLQKIAQTLLAENNFNDRFHFQNALRTLLCKNKQQWHNFDQIYAEFWMNKGKVTGVKQRSQSSKAAAKIMSEGDTDQLGKHASPKEKQETQAGASQAMSDLASAKELNEHIDFGFLEDEGMLQRFTESCHQLARLLAKKLRKQVKAHAGEQIDLRQSIQHNLKHSGDLFQLVWRKKPKILPRFTVLVDVSRSMSGYSNAFLVFSLAIMRTLPDTRVFIFNTRLVDISSALREHQLHKVKTQLALLNTTWGGGTRIAHSIAELQKRGVANSRAGNRSIHHFIIHSDGLDTDPAAELQQRLKALKKRYRSIIWLSPLMKDNEYQVETAALKGALPYIDHLLPVHNFRCLYDLTELMAQAHNPTHQGVANVG